MKRKTGFAALLAGIILLTGCREAVPVERETSESDSGGIQIYTYTTEGSFAPEETSGPPPTVPTESEQATVSETASETTAEPRDPLLPETLEEFSFPQEFYDALEELIARYGLNEGCDNTEDCLCEPEYELYDAEGNVTEPRKHCASIYFRDINSGFEFALNPGAHYPIASTIKIPFCTLIYRKIEAGEIDPEQVLTYEERHYFEGTGDIVKGDFGQQFTVRELLQLAITKSDNVAYEMLKDLVSWEEFSDFLAAEGCTHPEDLRKSKQKICCESAGAYGRILARYLRSGGEWVEAFKEDLLNTRLKMIRSDYNVYRKYGWAGFSFHDIAYIDAPRPYILAVMTNLEGELDSDYKFYKELSKLFQEYTQNASGEILSSSEIN